MPYRLKALEAELIFKADDISKVNQLSSNPLKYYFAWRVRGNFNHVFFV